MGHDPALPELPLSPEEQNWLEGIRSVTLSPTPSQEAANRIRWSPARRDFYEVQSLMWWDIANDVAGWLRYTLLTSRACRAEAAVWGGIVRLSNPSRSLTVKQIYPFSAVEISRRPFCLDIGGSQITSNAASGAIGTGETAVSWSVGFDTAGMEIAHLPASLRHLPAPPGQSVSANCGGRLSGVIEVAGSRYPFVDAPAVQSHAWGTKNAIGWSRGHCSNFAEDGNFVFDAVLAVDTLAGFTLKPLHLFFFRMDGVTYTCNGLITALFRNVCERSINGWSFTAYTSDLVFRGEVVARPEEMNLWSHEDPDGTTRQGHVSCTADCRIEVLVRRRNGTLHLIKTVTAARSALYEITLPEADLRLAHHHPTHLLLASA